MQRFTHEDLQGIISSLSLVLVSNPQLSKEITEQLNKTTPTTARIEKPDYRPPRKQPLLKEDELEKNYRKSYDDQIPTRKIDDIKDLKDPKYKVLIQTVNKNEFYAAMMELKDHKATEYIGRDEMCQSHSNYYVGEWGTIPVVIMQTGMGNNGVHSSWYETKKALFLMPHLKCIFSVGVCGGVAGKVDEGDVVVSNGIYGYTDIKMTSKCWINRSIGRLFTQSDFYNQFSRASKTPPDDITVKFGAVLSGPWLIADANSQTNLLNFAPEAIAFEMEGANIVEACGRTKVECLVVKGVSDLADQDKGDKWQPQAATNAVKYLSKALEKAEHLLT